MNDGTANRAGVAVKAAEAKTGAAAQASQAAARPLRKKKKYGRGFWLQQMRQWHWISAAISLIGMLAFAITGITLNHASQIGSIPKVTTKEAKLPSSLAQQLKATPAAPKAPVPQALADWVGSQVGVDVRGREAERSGTELYVSLPRPGGDAWLTADMDSGEVRYELTDRGWISYLNDLHKGRNTGWAWSLFLDVFAAACIVFCVTGLVLLQLMAVGRPSTWPIVFLGVAIPVVILLIFVH